MRRKIGRSSNSPGLSVRVGGYQVSERWLKERKDRMLGRDEIEHYPHFVAALSEARTLIE